MLTNDELVIWTIDRTLLDNFRNFSKFIKPSTRVSDDSLVKYRSFWHIGKNGILIMKQNYLNCNFSQTYAYQFFLTCKLKRH